MFVPLQFRAHALLHFGGGVVGVGERKNFVRAGVALANQVGDALREDGSLAGAGAGNHQHRSMNVLDGLPLAFVGDEFFVADKTDGLTCRRISEERVEGCEEILANALSLAARKALWDALKLMADG